MSELQARVSELRKFYETRLLDNCIPFWLKHAVDQEYGGFITSLDRDGSVVDSDKCVWQQGRFTWLLGELFNDPQFTDSDAKARWLATAIEGGNFLETRCIDPADGRLWFHLDRQGNPIRKRRYAFSESFAAIAFGELAKAKGSDHHRQLAEDTYARFLAHNRNPDKDQSKFTDQRPTRSIGFPMISLVTAQELRDSIGLAWANVEIDLALEQIEKHFVKPDTECVMETVSSDGELIDHFDGRLLNPGHAIEAAWFVMEEGRHRDDSQLVDLGCKMLKWMFARGWDDEFGGLLYFVDVNGLPVQEYWHDMKFWWPHNEAIIAALLAFELTGDEQYFAIHNQVHRWAFEHFDDPEFGDWFGYLHRDGSLSVPLKGNHWKGPFHYPRMLLQCIRILDRIDQQSKSDV